jgi:ankyrin repeat protein
LANGAAADIDCEDEEGCTPLADAEYADNEEIVALLEEQLDLKFPLHAAARTGDVETMKQLLDGGHKIDQVKQGEATPLIIACREGHVDAVKLLLMRGAEADREYSEGTPLGMACKYAHGDVEQLLIEHGAEVCAYGDDFGELY